MLDMRGITCIRRAYAQMMRVMGYRGRREMRSQMREGRLKCPLEKEKWQVDGH